MREPRHAHALADLEAGRIGSVGGDPTDHLVPGGHVRTVHRKIAFDDVQVGPAHPAGHDVDADLVRAELERVDLEPSERASVALPAQRTGLGHLPRLHRPRQISARSRRRKAAVPNANEATATPSMIRVEVTFTGRNGTAATCWNGDRSRNQPGALATAPMNWIR